MWSELQGRDKSEDPLSRPPSLGSTYQPFGLSGLSGKESPGGAFVAGGGRGFLGEERAQKGPHTRRVLARED